LSPMPRPPAVWRCSKATLVKYQRRPAMKTFITALAIVFVLATVTSMIALTVHGDRAHIDQGRHTVGHQKTALLY
jgi:hypothetical protein